MKKYWLILAACLSILHAGSILDDDAFKHVYADPQNSDKKVLMLYSATTCPQCAYMKEKVFKDKDVEAYMKKHFVVLHKDINTDDLPSGFDYFGIPTMFIIDQDGTMMKKIIGSSRAKPFLEKLHDVIEAK